MDSHLRNLLNWLAERPRTYSETMEAWRSTCPRLTAWEDALEAGYVLISPGATMGVAKISLTALGCAALAKTGDNDRS